MRIEVEVKRKKLNMIERIRVGVMVRV